MARLCSASPCVEDLLALSRMHGSRRLSDHIVPGLANLNIDPGVDCRLDDLICDLVSRKSAVRKGARDQAGTAGGPQACSAPLNCVSNDSPDLLGNETLNELMVGRSHRSFTRNATAGGRTRTSLSR